ncbi:FTSH10 [Symbiodinium natans]|uniref:FTSH10 protein n=1 Tax=Symbiodinium natans TaxID=878477 RepID=A0A812Q811_9DINO|nr:FTSH10 [Symbiodinium natans]
MLSKFRGSQLRLLARRFQPGVGIQEADPAISLRTRARPGRLGRSFVGRRCFSGEGKPPKGFEQFYKNNKSKPKESQTAESSKSEAPKETPKETPKESKEAESGHQSQSKDSSKGGKGSEKDPKMPSGGPADSQRQIVVFSLAAGLLAMYYASQGSSSENEITIQEMLRDYLLKGHVERLQIVNKSFCRVHLRPDAPTGENEPRRPGPKTMTIQLGSPDTFEAKLEQAQNDLGIAPMEHVPIQYIDESDLMSEILPHIPTLLFLIPLLFAARFMANGMGPGTPGVGGPGGRNIFSIGKAFPAGQKDLKSKVKFADVAGLDQAKAEVVEFVDFLRSPTKYEQLGARVPKGGLLVGPPGTGKTLLAKAVAGEADCPFFSMSGSDFIEMFVGVGPSRVRDLFQQARANSPSIIFIDEIDAVGRRRGKGGFSGGNDERENTLNQMLVEMDGFVSGTGVVVLAGTNRVDILDPALTRPGRFDRQIAIDKPDLAEREKIFMVHLKPVTLHKQLSAEEVAKRMASLTPGFAGADIANICNEAAIFAARRTAESVEMQDFERATERVLGGLPKQNSLMSPAEKRTVALHESGHAVAGWFLEHADPLLKVSIVPRSSGALGFAQYLPAEMSLFSKEAILDKIAVALGGRAAEELFVKKISTGASDDLDKVTKMAYSMVAVYGMNSELGLLSYGQNNASEQFYKPYSEETGRKIDEQTRSIVDEQYKRVKELLQEQSDKLQQLADRLAEKETLVYHDLVEVLGERPFSIKEELNKFVTAGGNPFTHDMGSPNDGENDKGDTDGQESKEEESASQAQSTGTEAKAPQAQA